jgi:hypothetical protein
MPAVRYAGIEKVNPEKLLAQHALTDALWTRLLGLGVKKGAEGRIESVFAADDDLAAAALVDNFKRGDWRHRIERTDDGPSKRRVHLVSPEVVLSPEAFHELVDVMMVAAVENRCHFDGFHVDVGAVRRRPWWRLW